MNRILACLTLLFAVCATTGAKVKYPGPKVFAYRYYLCDKQGSSYS